MTGMPYDRDRLSAGLGGREAAGRNYRTLADEYAEFAGSLRSSLGGNLLDLPEISGPYRELVTNLHERCRQVEMRLRHAGDGQVKAAANLRETEQAAAEGSGSIEKAIQA